MSHSSIISIFYFSIIPKELLFSAHKILLL